MEEEATLGESIPALLTTQLMAASLYSRYYSLASREEKPLWHKMLFDELGHVDYLHSIFDDEFPGDIFIPFINDDRIGAVCEQAVILGADSFLLRLEGALRLECAELDYGLEAFAAKRLVQFNSLVDYPGEIREHIEELVNHAKTYQASPNIGNLIARLEELYDTSVSNTTTVRFV